MTRYIYTMIDGTYILYVPCPASLSLRIPGPSSRFLCSSVSLSCSQMSPCSFITPERRTDLSHSARKLPPYPPSTCRMEKTESSKDKRWTNGLLPVPLPHDIRLKTFVLDHDAPRERSVLSVYTTTPSQRRDQVVSDDC